MNESYNSAVLVNGDYYTAMDMNYGLTHFIAKYLDTMYPIIGKQAKIDYADNDGSAVRVLTKPISLSNYFLCSNDGKRLDYSPTEYIRDSQTYFVENPNAAYSKIYNEFMTFYPERDNLGALTGFYKPTYNGKYTVLNDLPLFIQYDKDTDKYTLNENIIFTLDRWDIPKRSCELDNFVCSYLLGRTIGPRSSMEDIYYAQKLLIRDREITKMEKGVWCPPNMEGTMYDFTTTVTQYQAERFNQHATQPLFVTGYFDTFTEACALREVGATDNGTIYGI